MLSYEGQVILADQEAKLATDWIDLFNREAHIFLSNDLDAFLLFLSFKEHPLCEFVDVVVSTRIGKRYLYVRMAPILLYFYFRGV